MSQLSVSDLSSVATSDDSHGTYTQAHHPLVTTPAQPGTDLHDLQHYIRYLAPARAALLANKPPGTVPDVHAAPWAKAIVPVNSSRPWPTPSEAILPVARALLHEVMLEAEALLYVVNNINTVADDLDLAAMLADDHYGHSLAGIYRGATMLEPNETLINRHMHIYRSALRIEPSPQIWTPSFPSFIHPPMVDPASLPHRLRDVPGMIARLDQFETEETQGFDPAPWAVESGGVFQGAITLLRKLTFLPRSTTTSSRAGTRGWNSPQVQDGEELECMLVTTRAKELQLLNGGEWGNLVYDVASRLNIQLPVHFFKECGKGVKGRLLDNLKKVKKSRA